MLARKKLIAGKTETAYGTDANPGTVDVAVVDKDTKITPLEHDTIDDTILKPQPGNDPVLHVGGWGMVEVSQTLGIVSAAGERLASDWLLRAAGFNAVIEAGQKVTYSMVNEGHESASIYAYEHNDLTKLTGCRGNVKMEFKAKARPVISCDFKGLSAGPAAGSLPNPSLVRPKHIAIEHNNSSFTLGGRTEVMESISLDLGNEVHYQNLVGVESVEIVDTAPKATIVIQRPDAATKNYYTSMKGGGFVDASFKMESGGLGNELKLSGMQLASVKSDELDGVDMLTLEYRLVYVDTPVVQLVAGTLV